MSNSHKKFYIKVITFPNVRTSYRYELLADSHLPLIVIEGGREVTARQLQGHRKTNYRPN